MMITHITAWQFNRRNAAEGSEMSTMPGIPSAPMNVGPPVGAPVGVPVGTVPQGVQVGPPIGQAPPAFVTGQPAAPVAGQTPASTGEQGAEGDKPKRQRKPREPRVKYRQEGAPPLTAVPEDYKPRKHLPLAKADFSDEALFYDWKAAQARKQVAKYEGLAADVRTGGDSETRKQKKKLAKYMEGMQELQAKLESSIGKEAFQAMLQKMAADLPKQG